MGEREEVGDKAAGKSEAAKAGEGAVSEAAAGKPDLVAAQKRHMDGLKAGKPSGISGIFGKPQFIWDASKDSSESQMAPTGKEKNNEKTYDKPYNCYAEIPQEPEQRKALLEELSGHSSVVLDATGLKDKGFVKALKDRGVHVDAYISSSGLPDGHPWKEEFINKVHEKYPDMPAAKIFPPDLIGKGRHEATRVDETNDSLHTLWKQFIAGKAKEAKDNGAQGIFVDDVDNPFIDLRDAERKKGTAGLEGTVKYQRGINNHVDTINSMIDAFKPDGDEQPTVTLNRGQDLTEDGKHGFKPNIACSADPSNWKPSADGSGRLDPQTNPSGPAQGQMDSILKKTDKVMFESIGTEGDNIPNYRRYLQEVYKQSNGGGVIELTLYKNLGNDKGKAQEILDQMLTKPPLTSDEIKWARRSIRVNLYDEDGLEKENNKADTYDLDEQGKLRKR